MDEFNNKPNPFSEDNGSPESSGNSASYTDPYNRQPGQSNQYNQQPGQSNPYNQQPGTYQQGQEPYAPYGQQSNPYGQPGQNANPYGQQGANPYGQQGNPYNQQQGTYQQQGQYGQQGAYQQGQPYNPYVQQGGWQAYTPYPQKQSTGMAIASLVLGVISIVLNIYMIAFPFLLLVPIIGLILGIVYKCRKQQAGKGLSTAGIITSAIGLVIPLLILIIVVALLLTNGAEVMEFIKQYSPEDYEELYELYKDTFPEWFESVLTFLHK